MSVKPFDALAFPMRGESLIEASAGTGKTYSITSLFVRALLGIGEGMERPLGPDQILVVTFTNAATAELRKRIFERTVEVYDAFVLGYSEDDFIQTLLEEAQDREGAVLLLDAARRQMDEAAIFTIHGFCHRVLKECSFESGRRFELELLSDDKPLKQQAAEDFWRRHVLSLQPWSLSIIMKRWSSPAVLLRDIEMFIGPQQLEIQQDRVDASVLLDALKGKVERLKRMWQETDVADILARSKVHGGRKCRKAAYLEAMNEFAAGDDLVFSFSNSSWEVWSYDTVAEAVTKNGTVPEDPIFHLFSDVEEDFSKAADALVVDYTYRAIEELSASLALEKDKYDQVSNDDLLTQVYDALHAPGGDQLAQALAVSFPVAMVDEFQDTDIIQYGIFKSIYSRANAWLMIGDPKQAIYKFRGADVFTYMQARRDAQETGNGIYSLSTNWRSSSAMVAAVNALFSQAEQSRPGGAFVYRDQGIPYPQALASGKADKTPLLLQGEPITPLCIQQLVSQDGAALGSGKIKPVLSEIAAEYLAGLLAQSATGQFVVGDKPVEPGQVAVLVRTNSEARNMQQHLACRGINSAFLTRDSVFDAPIAYDLYFVLHAVLNPRREKHVFTALATRLLGFSAEQISALEHDLTGFQLVLDEFTEYQQTWQTQGVMAMLRQLSERRGLVAMLRTEPDGERLLTDFRHLSELLQQAGTQVAGKKGLLLWYRKKVLDNNRQENEDEQLRLDSEKNLVQIVTMHKSKGLEYDVVIIPSLSLSKPDHDGVYHNANFETVVDLLVTEESDSHTKVEEERLAEELRLCYVALTRACYHCYVGLANPKPHKTWTLPFERTAPAYLLGVQGPEPTDEDISASLQAFQAVAADRSGETLVQLQQHLCGEPVAVTSYAPDKASQIALRARELPVLEPDAWYMTSYSALVRGVANPRAHQGAMDEPQPEPAVVPAGQSAFSFPRGPRYGTLLHNLLEHIDYRKPQKETLQATAQQLRRQGLDPEAWAEFTCQWMGEVLAHPLGQGFCLGELKSKQQLAEMEFCFSLGDGFRIAELFARAQEYGYLAGMRQPSERVLAGMMKGFIDLVFEHQGCYYLADYKSNHLGDNEAHYVQARLVEAITEHHYDLQYLIYTVALHRYLGLRISDYDYDQHFGGVYYLFLRGMTDGAAVGSGVHYNKPPRALIEALDHLLGEGGA